MDRIFTGFLMLKRFACLSLSLMLLSSLGVIAHATSQGPEEALRSTVEHLQNLIQKNHAQYNANPASFYKVVDEVVVPLFDVPYISRLVLARYWRTATPEQRKAFESAFKNMLIRSYANALLHNAESTKVVWKPTRAGAGADDATVKTELVRDSGQKYPIGFSVHKVNGKWKIYDITIDNISLALNYRSQIDANVRREGLDAVIKRMQHSNMTATIPTRS